MARRGENIYFRKDGRWEGRYIKARKTDGKPIYGSVYDRKYSSCKEKLLQAKSLYKQQGQHLKMCGKGTVLEFMDYWLYSMVQPIVKNSTFANYVSNTEKWIQAYLGTKQLRQVCTEDVEQFVNILYQQKLSSGTIRNISRLLDTALQKACRLGYLSHNPCDGAVFPKLIKKESRLLTKQEQYQLEKTLESNEKGFLFLLSTYTGLRAGELCALQWKHVDLEAGVLAISETRQRIRNVFSGTSKTILITGKVKSKDSERRIPLPEGITRRLQEYRKESPAACPYVFSHKGKPLEPRILQYRFHRLLKEAGLPVLNLHSLRHTFATRCLELGVDIKTLSELLGHASAKMTLDKYGHSQLEHKQQAMQKLDYLWEKIA